MGEPNTPLAFRRRDECHLNQQAGHGKITVGIGQWTKNPIYLVANYNICFMHIVPEEESDRTLIKLCWRKNTSCETGIIQRYLSARFSTKTLESIRQNIGQSHALAIGHVVDIAFPIFESESSCP